MDEVVVVNLNVTAAELVVLAENLDIDPIFAVGDRSEAELDQMKSEGWRPLLARRFVRLDDDTILISSDLAEFAQDVLAPLGLLTHARIAGDNARISNVFAGRQALIDASPIAVDVSIYSSTDADSVVSSIMAESPDIEVDSVFRLETIDGQTQARHELLTWVRKTDGTVLIDSGDGTKETSISHVRARVSEIVESFSRIHVTED